LNNPSLAEKLYELFIARDDVYGVETSEGWKTVRGKLTTKEVQEHLNGKYTLGVYPFNRKGYIKWLCLDFDYKGGEFFAIYMGKKFSKESVIVEDTGGRGTHVWVFLQPTPLWQIADKITEMEKEIGVRIFPKQREWKTDTIGNFVRLPLGKHHKTGNWSKIVKGDIWTVKPYITCNHRIYDQYGDANCLAIDGTVGYCQQNLCPKLVRKAYGLE